MNKRIKGELLIAPNGDMAIRTSTGDFATGGGLIAEIGQMLREQGLTLAELVPEQHRHDDPAEAEHTHTHTHNQALGSVKH
jgi:hypothetical protein